jgi:hypothetical protein
MRDPLNRGAKADRELFWRWHRHIIESFVADEEAPRCQPGLKQVEMEP